MGIRVGPCTAAPAPPGTAAAAAAAAACCAAGCTSDAADSGIGSDAAAYISAVLVAPDFSAIRSTSRSAMLMSNPDLNASTSSFKTLPLGPEPFTFARSTPSCRASLRTVGAAMTDAPVLPLPLPLLDPEESESLLLLLLASAVLALLLAASAAADGESVWMSTRGAPTFTTSP